MGNTLMLAERDDDGESGRAAECIFTAHASQIGYRRTAGEWPLWFRESAFEWVLHKFDEPEFLYRAYSTQNFLAYLTRCLSFVTGMEDASVQCRL